MQPETMWAAVDEYWEQTIVGEDPGMDAAIARCIAAGLPPHHVAPNQGGKVTTIEMNAHHAYVARENFTQMNVADRVSLHVGNALDILPTMEEATSSGRYDFRDQAVSLFSITSSAAAPSPPTPSTILTFEESAS